jgi:hypothetical protein
LHANGFDSVSKIYLVYHVGDGDGCGRRPGGAARPGSPYVNLASVGCANDQTTIAPSRYVVRS